MNEFQSGSAPAPAENGWQCAGGERVLLVDDDPVARLLTASALAERQWNVLEVEDGVQALAAFEQHQPDVVVLDALMPGLDGFATCERLRRMPRGDHVPVLMLTGLDDEQSVARAYEAGATDFFVKTSSQWTLLSQRLRYMLRAARMREELAASEAKLSKAQRIARLGSWEWDVATRRVRLSAECFSIAGLTAQGEGLADWFVWSRVHEDERPRVMSLYADALAAGSALHLDTCIVRPDGQQRTVHVEAEIDRDDTGKVRGVHGVVQDITERKVAEDQIQQLANYDSLTGLPNRGYFRDQFVATLERARAHGSHAAVLFLDIDRFKQINDTLGQQVGDALLREMALRLHAAVRENDTVARAQAGMAQAGSAVARLGGDEFTILLTELGDPQAVERVALRLLEAMRKPLVCNGHEVFVTVSIGAALFPQHGEDADMLLKKADIAMYAVKEAGRNGWALFDDSMKIASADRWQLETALHRALERNELVLHYQPKIDVRTGRIAGAEALMRWQRGGKLVPPGEFIGLAEETGLIVPITEWAVTETCRRLASWRRAGIEIPVSVNISSRHLQRADLVEPVSAALLSSGVPAGLLELELTESVLMHNLSTALPLLRSLKQLGVSLSIDDFGTGYSSLAYLKRLPIDTLKIDRSFVKDLDAGDSDGAGIVGAIIAMARSLKLAVVAEGVETRAQMLRLYEQGCVLMQGWLFAKAMPAEEFVRTALDASRAAAWRADAPEAAADAPPVAAVERRGSGAAAGAPSASELAAFANVDLTKRWADLVIGRKDAPGSRGQGGAT
jgi:diguanylate cyclase (GGDEF)-like protein/PAS domain S-box-containing protein